MEWACGIRKSDNFQCRVFWMPTMPVVEWIGSTSRTCQFLENCLFSWSSKKQNSVALSTAEAEYVAAGACCAQVF